jgi:mono/diheme cytochrome c family protein
VVKAQKTWVKQYLLASAMIALSWSIFACAQAEEQRQGKEILEKLCARCHAVGRTGSSPNKRAPPFRSFSETKLYDSDFKQRLETGLISIHPFMPTFRFSTEEAGEVLSYMRSIQERRKPK